LEGFVKDFLISRPFLGFVVSTRVALGVGIGLLVANRLNRDQRRAAGSALLALGVTTTVPAIVGVIRSSRRIAHA
jgi:hypothetical protein